MMMEGPSEPGLESKGRGREWALLAGLMVAYALIFAAFYPPTIGIEDEVGYLNQALVWSRGSITAEGAGFADLQGFIRISGREVAIRQPGRSLVALPFVLIGGVRAAFLSGLLIHLLTTWVAGALLVRLGRSPLWAALVLFHPTLAIYSRTLMADEGAGFGLLLAALAVASVGLRHAGAWAGAAVGLAALMRYHAGIAMPIVAASFLLTPGRKHPRREAILCLIVGGLCGSAIVAYNLSLYHHPTDPLPTMRGSWSNEYIVPMAIYYGTALMTIWPAMLLAPLLDRTSIRWTVRGICGLYLALFLRYYWHDSGNNWVETAVLGLRLLEVALPIWVVSYAAVLGDRLAPPVLRVLGRRGFAALAAVACAGLLALTGLMFATHQAHLNDLLSARDAVVLAIPDGSTVVANGNVKKVFGVPSGLPSYRWFNLPYIKFGVVPEKPPWYLAVLAKSPEDEALAREVAERYKMTPVATSHPGLFIYHLASP
jgi:hypothetical protein